MANKIFDKKGTPYLISDDDVQLSVGTTLHEAIVRGDLGASNAGRVAYSSATTYNTGTVGYELNDLIEMNADTTDYVDRLAYNVDKLMKKEYPLTLSATISPTALQEKGSAVTVTLTWSATVDGSEPSGVIYKVNNVVKSEKTMVEEDVDDTKSYVISASLNGYPTATATKTVSFVYPIYTGFNAATAYVSDLEKSLSKQGLRSSLGTLSVTATNGSTTKYFWILSPYKVNHVKTSGIDIIADFMPSTETIGGGTYYTYRLSKASAVGSFTFELS